MNEISKNPKRHTFQEEGYIKHCEEKGEEPNPDYVNLYKTWREQDEENLVDPTWQKNNMEYDLRTYMQPCATWNSSKSKYCQFLKMKDGHAVGAMLAA